MDNRTDIKAIIFDLGRVLVNIHPERGIFGYLTRQFDHEPTEQLLLRLMNEEMIGQECRGQIDPLEFQAGMCRKYNLNLNYGQFAALWVDIFSPIEGMRQLVESLPERYHLGLLSDTDVLHWNYILEQYPWISIIKQPTLSFQVGVTKPHPLIYQRAVENAGYPPDSCLFIDDLERNVQGARAAGLQAIQFTGYDNLITGLQTLGILD